jgi:hypothetical protein
MTPLIRERMVGETTNITKKYASSLADDAITLGTQKDVPWMVGVMASLSHSRSRALSLSFSLSLYIYIYIYICVCVCVCVCVYNFFRRVNQLQALIVSRMARPLDGKV